MKIKRETVNVISTYTPRTDSDSYIYITVHSKPLPH